MVRRSLQLFSFSWQAAIPVEAMGLGVWVVLAVLFTMLGSSSAIDQADEVYISNRGDIEVVQAANNVSRVVYPSASTVVLETMDCNTNDTNLYWISGMKDGKSGAIKRGAPNNNGTDPITILDEDIFTPKGIAVDWSTSNIYFSHILNDHSGRVEVVSKDGRNRRVLFYGFMGMYIAPATGALAVNVLTGYLYFINSTDICRSYMDGSHWETVIEGNEVDEYDGLTIDEETNILYWTVKVLDRASPTGYFYYVRSLSIPEFESSGSASSLVRSRTISLVHDVFVYNRSMYLTVPSNPGGTIPGAILFVDVMGVDWSASVELDGRYLWTQNSFDPRGVCTFKNMSVLTGPCSGNVCEASALCFTIPDGQGGTKASCGCSTGLTLNQENNMTCASVPEHFLLFTRLFYTSSVDLRIARSEIRLIPLEEDQETFVDVLLPFDLADKEVVHIAYDILSHQVYWTEWTPPCIKRANFNGNESEVFINSSIYFPEGLVVDPYGGNLYWTDSRLNIISVTSLTNPSYRKTLFQDVQHPQGLALDVVRGYLYWTDVYARFPVVERSLLNGQGRTQISQEDLSPTNIAVDSDTGNVYWLRFNQQASGRSTIVRYILQEQRTEHVSMSGPDVQMGFDLAIDKDYLYWTDRGGSQDRGIARVPKIGGTVEIIDGFSAHGLITVNNTRANISTAAELDVRCRGGPCDQLCFQTYNSSRVECACSDHFISDSSTSCTDPSPRPYIALGSQLQEFEIVDDSFYMVGAEISLGNGTVKAMDAYVLGNMVYWIDGTDRTIKRRSLNASVTSGNELVVSCCLSEPEDLAVDWFGLNIYWTDSARHVIEVATMSGSGRMILLEVDPNLGPPGHIVLDPIRGYVYWTSLNAPKIYGMKMDGSSPPVELHEQSSCSNGSITALAISFQNDHTLYWALDCPLLPSQRYQLYHSVLSNFFPFSSSTSDITGVITDIRAAGGQVYYAVTRERAGSVQSRIEYLPQNDLSYSLFRQKFSFFFFVHHSTQPGRHVCQVSSQCNGESFCLVSDKISRQCRCDARRLWQKVPLTDDVFGCTLHSTFLLLGTDSLVHYVPLPGVGKNTSVRRLPFTPQGTIVDIAYNPVNSSVMWITENSTHLTSVKLDSSAEWSIPISMEPLQTFSLAYDWRGGHVFFTEKDSFEIRMAVVNGDGRGTMVAPSPSTEGGSLLNKPGEVLMDSKEGILYYTIRDGLSNESRSLRELNLRSITQSKELPVNKSLISKLTFDPTSKVFYWVKHRPDNREGDVIEKYSIATKTVVEIAAWASRVEALGALTIYNQTFVYWYNRTDSFLYRHGNSFPTTRYLRWEVPDTTKVVRIIGYNSSTLLVSSLPCLDAQRPCSHLCTDESATPTCHCPLYTTPEVSNNSVCRQMECSGLTFPCNDEFGSCFPKTYFCDNIQHCSNGEDERNCTCVSPDQGCFSDPSKCYHSTQRCDGKEQCPDGEDEMDCCTEVGLFGCFVNAKDSNPPYYFDCLHRGFLCDEVMDCRNGEDEQNCSSVSTPTLVATTSASVTDSLTATVVITLLIISVITVVVVVVIVISVVRLMWKKRAEARSRHSISYLRQPHDSNSDYSNSEVSHNTNTTQINGSSISHCANSKPMDLTHHMNLLNPPPSPSSTIHPRSAPFPRHSLALSEEDDDISRVSQSFSEYAPPPPPCPSINYDNVSMSAMSISVSQSRYPATINNGGPAHPNNHNTQQHYQYQHYHHPSSQAGGVARHSGRNPNPLLSRNTVPQQQHQQPHHYEPCNGGIPYQERVRNGAVQCHASNHLSCNMYAMRNRRQVAYPDISEQDTIAQLETESTMSTAIDNGVYPYDASMPHQPPPGRPPSPVTMYSEYHGQPPLSPQSSRRSSSTASTASFSSQD